MLLVEIRGKIIFYATYAKKEEVRTKKKKKDKKKQLIGKLMEGDLKQNSVPFLGEKKHQLQAMRNRRLEGMMVRPRVIWIENGEKKK